MACMGPIFRRMMVVPVDNTITCGESMGTTDDEDDNFCKKAVSSSSKSCMKDEVRTESCLLDPIDLVLKMSIWSTFTTHSCKYIWHVNSRSTCTIDATFIQFVRYIDLHMACFRKGPFTLHRSVFHCNQSRARGQTQWIRQTTMHGARHHRLQLSKLWSSSSSWQNL